MRCSFFDGFPCLLNGKADAQVMCIDPMLAAHDNVTLLTGAYVSRLDTDASGRRVEAVHVDARGPRGDLHRRHRRGGLRRALLGAAAAALRQRAAPERPRQRLRTRSAATTCATRCAIVMAVMKEVNETVFQKTLALQRLLLRQRRLGLSAGPDPDVRDEPRRPDQGRGAARPGSNGCPTCRSTRLARHSMDFWLQAEDLPHPDNRVYYKDGKVHLDVVETNPEALKHLKRKLKEVLSKIGWPAVLLERSLYLGKNIPLSGTAHQAGTCRFGTDPATSVLNLDCRAHEVDNLYVTDASFFPSIGAVNPTLTIIANALARRRHPEGPAVSAAAIVALVVRYGMVMLFLPFSALDKVLDFDHAVKQAQEVFKPRPLAVAVLLIGLGDRGVLHARRRHRRRRPGLRLRHRGLLRRDRGPLQALLGAGRLLVRSGRQGADAVLGFPEEPVARRRLPAARRRHGWIGPRSRSSRHPFASSHPYGVHP